MKRKKTEIPINGDAPEAMGYEGIAAVLREHFKVTVNKQDVADWCHGKRLGAGVPHFPPPKSSGRYNKLVSINWYAEHKFKPAQNGVKQTPDLLEILVKERNVSELERLDHERMLRGVERNQYIERAEHERILASLGKIGRDNLWELFDQRIFQLFPPMMAGIGIPEEWQNAAMAQLRELMPRLLNQHHEFLEQMIKQAEEEK